MTKLDEFNEEWYALSASERCRIYLDYLREYDTEEAWYEFDEEFFQIFFEDNPMEAVRATFFWQNRIMEGRLHPIQRIRKPRKCVQVSGGG